MMARHRWTVGGAALGAAAAVLALAGLPGRSAVGGSGVAAAAGATGGQFATPCRFSHRAQDDPIVHPGGRGMSHSHDFFGNVSTNAASTLETLRAAGTTCRRPQDTAAYWVPTLFDAPGRAVAPLRAQIYYLTAGKEPATIVAPPAGLKVIAGDAKATGPQDRRTVRWGCAPGAPRRARGPGPLRRLRGAIRDVRRRGQRPAMPAEGLPPRCAADQHLVLHVRFPDCWDGNSLDSADHRSHLAYAVRARGQAWRTCPATHPAPLPLISFNVHYQSRGGRFVTLSSGPAYTAHADFFNAWDQAALEELVRRCLNGAVVCGAR